MIADLKPYAEYKESGLPWLGQVPGHWETRRLKQIARLAYGDALPRTGRIEGTVPVFGSNGKVGWHSDSNTMAPCIVVGRKGSFGKVNFCSDAAFVIDTAFFIDGRLTKADIRWLYYTLGWIRLDGVSKDSAIPGLDREDAYQQVAAIPPPDEQAAIVRFLDWANGRLERAIRAKRKVIALLNEQKQAIIHRAVTRGLDPSVPLKPSGIPWLGDIPQHWGVRRLKSLCRFVTSGSRGWARYYTDTGFVFLRIGNISTTSVDLRLNHITYVTPPAGAEGERTRALPDDLLLSITAQIGAVGVVPKRLGEAFVNQHTALIRLRQGESVPRWVAFVLLSNFGKDQCRLMTNGGTKVGLTLDDVRCLAVLLPPLEEQAMIVTCIERRTSALDTAISRLEREIELLREYRTRLVADVVTGKLDVREAAASLPEVENASAVEPELAEIEETGDELAGEGA